MIAGQTAPKNIDEYIAGFPPHVQEILEKIRRTVSEAAPDAKETIKYGMPTFTLKGNLVYFAAYKQHIGVFPPVAGNQKLNKQLAAYRGAKGSFRFPLGKPIPFGLIREIVKLRVKEDLERAAAK